MGVADNALTAAMSSGTFTPINNKSEYSLTPPSGQIEVGKENVPPSYYSGQSAEEQDSEFHHQLKTSITVPRNGYEESLDDVGLFESSTINPQTLEDSIEVDTEGGEVDSDIEQEYIYQDVIREARGLAETEQPEFCVKHRPKIYKKTVYHFGTDEEEYPNPDDGQEYAVKHDCSRYYIWRGTNVGFDEEPIASMHPNTKKESESSRKSPSKKRAAKSPSTKGRQALDAFDTSDLDSTPRRNLRDRTDRQQHPFQADKIEHKHASKGIKLTDQDLARELKRTRSPTASGQPRKRKSTSSHRSSVASSVYSVIDRKLATVRTHFLETGSAFQTLAFEADTADDLIDQIEEQWNFALGDRKIKHCTVSLPWKAQDCNLLLVRNHDMGNTFDTVIEEVRRAPTWKEEDDICFIDIKIHV